MSNKIYFYSPNRAAHIPLVWGCLRAYAETFAEVKSHYVFEPPFFLLEHKIQAEQQIKDPYMLLISCYIWNMRKNLDLARRIKQAYPDVYIVAGGPQVPNQSAPFFRQAPFVDFAVHGEGEIPLARLLIELLQDRPDFATVPSLTYRDSRGGVVRTPQGDQLPKDIEVPSPYLQGFLDQAISDARALGHDPIALWETNRGCPYHCTFCDWGSATMSKIRKFADARLDQEIEYFARERIPSILCCDANFGILPRDFGLARKIVAQKVATGFPQKFVTNYAKNPNQGVLEISKLFVSSQMSHGTILAMQSTSSEVLEAVRRSNIPFRKYRVLSSQFQEAEIENWTEMILGLPRETRRSFISGLCHVLELGIHDDIMVYECVALPNSELGSPEYRKKHGLMTISRPYLLGDIEEVEVVVKTDTLSFEDWVYCYLFGCLIQALHNRAATRLVAIYLHQEQILAYRQFYQPLLDYSLARPDTVFGRPLRRVKKLLEDYLHCPEIPNTGKIKSQEDMMEVVREILPAKRDWLLYEWCWAHLNVDLDRFYREIDDYLSHRGIEIDSRLKSLFRYQRNSVHTLGDDPSATRVGVYDYDWPEYFRGGCQELQQRLTITEFRAPAEVLR